MNKKLLGVGALALAVALTSASVSGTYAKYITKLTSSTDTARVAKWGITKDTATISIDLFKNSYTDVSATEKVVAPGTSGSYAFAITDSTNAKPEVDYKIVLDTTGSTSNIDDGKVMYSLDGQDYDKNFSQLLEALNAIEITGKAGQSLSEAISGSTHTIYWKWEFGSSEDDQDETNSSDTELGNTGTASVNLKVNVTVKQTSTTE